MNEKPTILSVRTTARSKLFEIEVVRLKFSNGHETDYERVTSAKTYGAVIVVPVKDREHFLLVREYTVGFDRYELGLPKGLLQEGESAVEGANRELMEELGYRAARCEKLHTLTLAAGFLCYATDVVLAQGLFPQRLRGDEPERLEVVSWPVQRLDSLIARNMITDARSIAALYLAKTHLELERQTA